MKENGIKNGIKNIEMFDLLKLFAPGTQLREGLENILKAKMGGLIVIGDSEEIIDLIDGGFFINKEYNPAHLYELSKMDGAIILSKDLKKILYANVLLVPDSKITTNETGTRHKSAERVAKQTSEIVISISQRRNIITIYKGNMKYILRDSYAILTRANQAIQTLEKYTVVLSNSTNNLTALEFENAVTMEDVTDVIKRTEMVMRIVNEIELYLCELGDEGRLVNMQLEELFSDIETSGMLVIEDYMVKSGNKSVLDIRRQLKSVTYEELMDLSVISKTLGYSSSSMFSTPLIPRGYRVLCKIPKLPLNVVKNLIEKFVNLQDVLNASIEELCDVDGIGESRAKIIKDGLKRIQEQATINKI